MVLSINGASGPALTGMPPIVVYGGGAGGCGDVATAPCRTGLPLNLLGSVTAGAGAATATGADDFVPDNARTFARSSAFSFSILSRRAMTSSIVADRAVLPNATRQSAAPAVLDRSIFFMGVPSVESPACNSRASGA
ncbi:MAG: hypothetical protein GY844_01235 [Bradyrhizobium sp.]|nr:hypothetical protein [Bradyrhizobium sp.]